MSTGPITEEMSVPEIVAKYPKTRGVFEKYGIRAEGYKALEYENLFASSRVHQIDLQKILAELNKAI